MCGIVFHPEVTSCPVRCVLKPGVAKGVGGDNHIGFVFFWEEGGGGGCDGKLEQYFIICHPISELGPSELDIIK